MPTKKRRVGFIPRPDVLVLINKLSYENNLSYSKIINILVEEALHKRGMINYAAEYIPDQSNNNIKNKDQKRIENLSNEFTNNIKNYLLKDENINKKEAKEDTLDNEIYSKFLMFLQFRDKIKKDL